MQKKQTARQTLKLHGFLFKPAEARNLNLSVWRVYGTRQAFIYPGGRVAAQPGTWEFITEFLTVKKRGRVGFPDIELEPTTADGWQFYNLVPLDENGKEVWHADNELILPQTLPNEFEGELDVPSWILWNLEKKGLIAPGQLQS